MKFFLPLIFLFAGIIANSQQIYDADLGSYIDITDRGDPSLYIKDTQFDTLNQITINAGAIVTLTNNTGVTVSRGKMLGRWVSNKIMPARTGKTYNVRVDFRAIPTVSVGSYGRLLIDIGGSQGVIVDRVFTFPRGANIMHPVSLGFPIFCENDFVNNGGAVKIFSSDLLTIYDFAIMIAD